MSSSMPGLTAELSLAVSPSQYPAVTKFPNASKVVSISLQDDLPMSDCLYYCEKLSGISYIRCLWACLRTQPPLA